jgi:hypothetical protein
MKVFEVGTKVVFLDKSHPEYYGWVCRVIRHQPQSTHYHVLEGLNGNYFLGDSGNRWGAKNGTLEDVVIYDSPLLKVLK